MKVLILSPLFPPDVGGAALYAKHLVQKLSHHETTVISYGPLPEDVAGVHMHAVPKRGFKLLLVWRVWRLLATTDAELFLIHSGPSSELPALLLSLFSKRQIVLLESDPTAPKDTFLYRLIHRQLVKQIVGTIVLPADQTIYLPPEKLPFTATSEQTAVEQAAWWQAHVKEIERYV